MVSVRPEPNPTFMDAANNGASDEKPLILPTRSKIQAAFLIARSPRKPTLYLTPKLLLQFQQLTSEGRLRSVINIRQPSIRKSKLTREFRQRPKLRSGDSFATYDEPYAIDPHNAYQQRGISGQLHEKHRTAHNEDAIAVMCHSTSDNAQTPMISFRNDQCTWRISTRLAGHTKREMRYRFTINYERSDEGLSQSMSMQWEKRLPDGGASASAEGECESGYFALCFIDHEARRKCRIATMTRSGLNIRVRKSSVIEHLQRCMNLALSPVSGCEYPESLEAWLYTHVLIMGAWVADREGWVKHP
ncbi:hypothetical protein EN45_064810 [Penicillium chrysogenum]|uniref:Uncharacterized protein n=2 Tax=Penicillium chrysogenum species complex TaxID=254878 RepID=B6HNJ8_PENRW|nr:uncharacterized protein N7525_008458 [Penicillium rubens]KAJ5263123.1 hypothetical protein N7524_008428 [Penicillium chrysogenum]CAP94964.1 hypothetical protein PCH_Pc21g00670 [Penicillium rubens Wisconsin 54-1255]KAJ5830205.1 hypothetical protein N7525_008458 [Penicillium rubens]KAJ5853786.1 hypothetical protein N7534_006329 [Penicillium rubens]KZN87920.1 hypothetical protein EN45_064810 [Penicillium chrysogenum]